MDFEKFLRDILKKFQEGIPQNTIFRVFLWVFPYLLDKDEFEEGQRARFLKETWISFPLL
tara:strand:+ start:2495 stop:2674 length:180 start_codon:yes stop_codon:yes gene_type:complete